MNRFAKWTCLIAAVGFAACDSGPSGPGTLDAVVTSESPLGAVVLEITGAGVQGFEEQGSTRAVGATLSAPEGRHRVVLVAPDGTQLRFGIRVDDLATDDPAVVVVRAVSPSNIGMLTTGIGVGIER